MSPRLDAIARLQMEAEFAPHAPEVLQSGCMPQLQLQLAVATPSHSGWRPEYGDPESYLQSVYNCLQQ